MNQTNNLPASIKAEFDPAAEMRRVFVEEISALQTALNRLADEDERESSRRAVEMLLEAPTVLLSGVGKSGIIARKIAATLTSTGTRALFLHPVEALHGDIGFARAGDVCLMLSKSGSTAELLALVPTLKSLGVRTLALVGAPDSPLARLADVAIDASVEREACPIGVAPMSSATLALVWGDALAAALIRARKFTAERFAAFHAAGQLGKNLTLRADDVMHGGDRLPKVRRPASFRQILEEITAKGLGCACVINDDDTLAGIVTDGDTRRALQRHTALDALRDDDVMTRSPVTVAPDTLLGAALELMEDRAKQINVLPVVDERGVCLGVVRLHDIVRAGI